MNSKKLDPGFVRSLPQLTKIRNALYQHENIEAIVTNLNNVGPVPWNDILVSLEKEAINRGLSALHFRLILEIVVHPLSPTTVHHKSRLLFSLIPRDQLISSIQVTQLVTLILRQTSNLLTENLFIYLNGIFNYNICTKDAFNNFFNYSVIISALNEYELIPWTCCLLKKITTKSFLLEDHVESVVKIIKSCDLDEQYFIYLVDILAYFKMLRPEHFLNQEIKIPNRNSPPPTLQLRHEFSLALYNSKSRLVKESYQQNVVDIDLNSDFAINDYSNNEDLNFKEDEGVLVTSNIIFFTKDALNNLNKNCFREFPLHFSSDSNYIKKWGQLHRYDFMRCTLKSKSTLPLLVADPEAMQHFYNYISLILQHKFNPYPSKEDEGPANFLLERICEISFLRNSGLPPVDEWLLENLSSWDGEHFQEYFIDLLGYLNPIDLSDKGKFLERLAKIFLKEDNFARILYLDTFNKIFKRWTSELAHYALKDNTNDSMAELQKSLTVFYDWFHSLISQVKDNVEDSFLYLCIRLFIDLQSYVLIIPNSPIYVVPPIELWYLAIMSDSLLVMDAFCELALTEDIKPKSRLKEKSKYVKDLDNWFQNLKQEVVGYFNLSRNAPCSLLFNNEIVALGAMIDDDELSIEEKEHSAERLRALLTELNKITAFQSVGFQEVLNEEVNENLSILQNLNLQKANVLIPNVIKFLRFSDPYE